MRLSIIGALALAFTTTAAYADSQKPTVPDNVVATPLSDTSVRVTWSKPYDNVGIAGYNIYRNRSYYATVHFTTNFVDTRVSTGQTYDYAVVAFDDARNYTILSEEDDATPGGNTSGAAPRSSGNDSSNGQTPSPPGGLRAEVKGSDRIALFWNEAGGAAGYNIYRDGSYRTTIRGTSWTDTGLSSDREYRYNAVSFSSDAKFSNHSGDVTARTSGGSSSGGSSENVEPQADQAPVDNSVSSSGGAPSGYQLVFNDEFNGSSLDSSKWNSAHRWGPNLTINNEQQYYVDAITNPDRGSSPFSFNDGKLSISADKVSSNLKSSSNNKSYQSGVLTTYNKFKMKYGYVEMRAKLPKGQGLWPALWLLHQYENGQRPEIDIMEFLGNEADTVYNVYHYYSGGSLKSTPSYESVGPDYTAGFHTYGMKWEPGKITWYVDGTEANSYSGGGVSNEDMYLIVNLALGGAWGGNVDGSTPFPSSYVIDYIRAYKR